MLFHIHLKKTEFELKMLCQRGIYKVTWGVRRRVDGRRMGQAPSSAFFRCCEQRKEDPGLTCTMHLLPTPRYIRELDSCDTVWTELFHEMHPYIFIFNQGTNHVGVNTTENPMSSITLNLNI